MKIWIATADVAALQRRLWAPLEGVITNPTVLLQPGNDWRKTLGRLAAFDDDGVLRRSAIHVQAIARDETGIRRELEEFRELVAPKDLVCKIPMGEGGLRAARRLAREGAEVNVTAVCNLAQLHLAAHAGAKHVSVYVARINDRCEDAEAGFRLLEEGRAYLEAGGFPTEIIAASVRNPQQYQTVIRCGAHAVAAPPELLDQVLHDELTESSLQAFTDHWERSAHG